MVKFTIIGGLDRILFSWSTRRPVRAGKASTGRLSRNYTIGSRTVASTGRCSIGSGEHCVRPSIRGPVSAPGIGSTERAQYRGGPPAAQPGPERPPAASPGGVPRFSLLRASEHRPHFRGHYSSTYAYRSGHGALGPSESSGRPYTYRSYHHISPVATITPPYAHCVITAHSLSSHEYRADVRKALFELESPKALPGPKGISMGSCPLLVCPLRPVIGRYGESPFRRV